MTDTLHRFILEHSNWRGELVQLHSGYADLIKAHSYPPFIQQLLVELTLSSVLLRATIKTAGILTLQYQNNNAIKLLLARCNDQYEFRGIARWDEQCTTDELHTSLLQGLFIMTFQGTQNVEPVQSIIPVESTHLPTLIEQYFARSEQIPTRIFFAHHGEEAYGLLLQKLPSVDSEITPNTSFVEQAFDELCNKRLPVDRLLSLLFPEEPVTLLEEHQVSFNCGCSVEKVKRLLPLLGQAECENLLEEHGEVSINCEFCNKQYKFTRNEVLSCFN